jgi:PAS domain S-box-containing protein
MKSATASPRRRQGAKALAVTSSKVSSPEESLDDLPSEGNEWDHQLHSLSKQEAFFRNIVETAQEGIWHINAESLTDYVNPKMAEMMGYHPAEMLGRPISDFLDAAGRAELASHIKRRKGGVSEQFEFRYQRKDGSMLWAFVSTNPVFDPAGNYLGAVALLTDIGQRKKIEQQLAHTADLLTRTGEMAKVGGWELDLRSGELFWSAETCRIFEVAPENAPNLEGAIGYYEEDDRPKIQQAVAKAIKHGTSYELELRVKTATGRTIWTRSHGSSIREGRRVVRLVGTVQDITERKEVELKYLRELEFNTTLVDHTAAIILLLDVAGRIVHVNEATTQLLGYDRTDLLGHTLWEVGILDADRVSFAGDRIHQLLAGTSPQSCETRLYSKQGHSLVFALSSVVTRLPDGSIDRIILSGSDLTERNRLQKELLNTSEREQARIGHNLHDGVGQTLTGVASLIEALESELPAAQRPSVARIHELVQAAIQEVRHLSHSMSPAAVKNRGLAGVLRLLADTLRLNHRIICDVMLESGFQISNEEQENHLYRIAQEACNNAIRHGKASHISITLSRTGEREGLLQITDNGCGMTGATKKKSKGIGLQVMDYRANLIGGTLKIEGGGRSGLSVSCRFPCDPVTRLAKRSKQPARKLTKPDLGAGI